MEAAVTAALITGTFGFATGIATSVGTPFIKDRIEGARRIGISDWLQRRMTGRWEGLAHQDPGPGGKQIHDEAIRVSLNLTAGKRVIKGSLRIETRIEGVERVSDYDVRGGFFRDWFVLMNYIPQDDSTQFGSILLRVNEQADVLEGKYVGYGKFTQSVVSGSTKVEKRG